MSLQRNLYLSYQGAFGPPTFGHYKIMDSLAQKVEKDFGDNYKINMFFMPTSESNSKPHLKLSKDSRITTNRSELFLFAADRTEHINQVIKPALNDGKWVVCDRYIDSTFAYQYGGRQHPKQDILDIIRLTQAIEPDLTFYLDVSVEEGLRRASSRGVLDRFEQETLDFHERVRAAYLECAQINSHRTISIAAEGHGPGSIFESIKQELNQRSVVTK